MFLPHPFELTSRELPTVNLCPLGRMIKCSLLTVAGVFFLVLGIVGIYLPGIPTTGPVLLSLALLAKGCPKLQEKLRQRPMMRTYFAYFDGTKVFSQRARWIAATCMWFSIAASCWLLSLNETIRWPAIGGCLFGGVIGSITIARYRRNAINDSDTTPVSDTVHRIDTKRLQALSGSARTAAGRTNPDVVDIVEHPTA